MNLDQSLIQEHLDAVPHELLFVTMSGAHLYGFASPDSDYDLRGAHVARVTEVLRLSGPRETFDVMDRSGRIEMDLVTHDVRKFFSMLLKKNGYVLEQIFSPIVVQQRPEFEELRRIAAQCVTRFHHYHFDRFSQNQWEQVAGPDHGTVKGLLYTYRPLMAGIHLMTEGVVESNIVRLNERFGLGFIDELVQRKIAGREKDALGSADLEFHREQFESLRQWLHDESERSGLPVEVPESARRELDDLLVRLRLATLN